MASYVTPKKNTAYKFYVALVDQSNTKLTKANPTIASGDFKVSTDGAAFANLATLPSANPASGRAVMIDLSSGEMNGDNIVVQCVDAAGAEWCDLVVNIQTSVRQIDDLAFPNTSGRGTATDASGLVDANMVKVGPTGSGTAQTARDIGASVLLSAGTGTGQLDFTSGVVKSSLVQILGTALTETAGQIAAAFKQFFDVASPTGTMKAITNVVTTTTATNLTTNNDKTGYALSAAGVQAIWDALTSALTTVGSIGKLLVDNVNATISSRSTYAGGDTSGTTTLLSRLSSARAGYLDNLSAGAVATASKLTKYVQLMLRKDAAIATDNSAEVTEINADGGSGAGGFANTTDSQEAIRDNMGTAQTGDTYALANGASGFAATKTVADGIKAKTDNLPAAPAAVGDIPTAVQNADALLGRNLAGGSSTGRTVKQALRVLRNKWTNSGGTYNVYQEDDATLDWSSSISTDAAAVPIIGSDPA